MVKSNPSLAINVKIELISKLLVIITAFALPLSTALTNIGFISAAIFMLAAGNLREKFQLILTNRVALMLLAFFALFIIGLSYTTAPFSGAVWMMGKYSKLFFGVLLLPIFTDEKVRRYSLNAFMVAMLLVMFLSYLKAFGWVHYDPKSGPVEIFRGHIAFNFLLGFLAYLFLTKIFAAKTLFCRVVLTILWILCVIDAVFLCTGRTGYVIVASLTLLFFLQKLSWKGMLIALVGIGLLGLAAYSFSPTFKGRYVVLLQEISVYKTDQNQNTSMGDRFNFWKNSVNLIKARPVIGYGTGSFQYEYAKIKPTPAVLTHNPHNEYLLTGVQFGVVGILLLLALFATQLWESRRLPKETRYIAQAVVLSIMLGCLANSWLFDTTQGHFYAYFVALTFALLGKDKTNEVLPQI